MKISGCTPNAIAKTTSHRARADRSRISQERPEIGTDSVSLSSDAKELSSSVSRSVRLEKLKNDLDQGRYSVDTDAIARNLLNRELEVDFTGLDHTIKTGGGEHA